VALPLDHPLARRDRVSPLDVIGEEWIAPPAEFPIDRVLTAIAARAGSPVRVVRRTTHLPLMEKLVSRGHGIALLPRHTTRERAAGRWRWCPWPTSAPGGSSRRWRVRTRPPGVQCGRCSTNSWPRPPATGPEAAPAAGRVRHSGSTSVDPTAGDTGVMAIPVGLGMPAAPPPVLAPRRRTRQLDVGGVGVGSDHPVSVQSMCTTKTADINATLQQIAELTASGCQIVRVAVPDTDDAEALPIIARKSQIPVIADIHFQPRYVFAAIDAGCAAVRVNPGNIKKFDDKVGEIARAAKDAGIPIRIGVNAGSLDKRLLAKYGKATPEALVESALWECSLFEEHDFRDIKISVKHNDPVIMVRAYELLAAQCDYPLHLGVTEAGPAFQGTIKSAVAFGALLSQGIGDTIRVSLSAPPAEEVKVGNQILESLNLRQRGLEIVSCPSCGRAQVDVYKLADEVTAGLEGMEVPLRVAVMGCVVNGPGEAREADLGVASGNGKGQIFVKGEVIKTVPESQIVETLIEEALKIADAQVAAGEPSGPPVVTVS
jgi:(E)-4-hydroxy-3-methylbut-2-enyl-diphosphate synthase